MTDFSKAKTANDWGWILKDEYIRSKGDSYYPFSEIEEVIEAIQKQAYERGKAEAVAENDKLIDTLHAHLVNINDTYITHGDAECGAWGTNMGQEAQAALAAVKAHRGQG